MKKFKLLFAVVILQAFMFAQVDVALPDTVVKNADGSHLLPITIANVPEEGITNFNLWFSFDNMVIDSMDVVKEGTLMEGFDKGIFQGTRYSDTQYRIGWVAGNRDDGTKEKVITSGTLIKLYVNYVDTGYTDLNWDKCDLSDGTPSNPIDGSITVLGNQKPVFQSSQLDTVIKESELLEYNFFAEDPEGGTVQYTPLDSPQNSTVNSSTGLFSWQPDFDDAGEYEFVIEATDGEMIAKDSVFITVVDSNRVPTIINSIGDTTISEGDEFNFSYQANDPDEDALEFALVDSIEGITVANNGDFSWTPTAEQVGTHQIVVSVTDGVAIVTDTSEIEVILTNRAPVFTDVLPDTTISEGELLNYTYAASDTNDDELSFSLISSVAEMDITADGEFTWIPGFGDAGAYNVIVAVSDEEYAVSHTAVVTVEDVNRSPETFSLIAPGDGDTVVVNNNSEFISFSWESSNDPDEDEIYYILESSLFDSSMVMQDSSVQISDMMVYNLMDSLNINYYNLSWSVRATDGIDTVESEDTFGAILRREPLNVDRQNGAPNTYALYDNYPNPFNPTTQISFDLPKVSKVLLKIYNLNGTHIETINFGSIKPGRHNYTFNASEYSSGIYIYKLEADNFSAIKKMTLIK